MTNLDSILKSRDITLPTKAHLVKVMVFPVVMYGCESWIVKKAECRRIDALKLWCWRRLLRVPWTSRRSHQSILKEISPGCSLEGMMLKLKLQYFGHLMRRVSQLIAFLSSFSFLAVFLSFVFIYLFLYLWWPALSSFSFMLYLLYVFSLFWPCILLKVYYIYIILVL